MPLTTPFLHPVKPPKLAKVVNIVETEFVLPSVWLSCLVCGVFAGQLLTMEAISAVVFSCALLPSPQRKL